MPHIFENSAIQLEINPLLARWSASSRHVNGPSLEDLQINLGYRKGRKFNNLLDSWPEHTLVEEQQTLSPHGSGKLIQLQVNSSPDQIKTTLTFALPAKHPILLWKISIENQNHQPVNIEALELFSAGYIHQGRKGPNGQINFPISDKSISPRPSDGKHSSHPLNLTFFSNGWQSWSRSGSYGATDQYLQTQLGFLRKPLVVNAQTPNPRRSGMFASDMYGVLGDHISRNGILCGFLSQKNHFGSIETWLGGISPALKMWANGDGARLDPGSKVETDWACIQFLHLDNPDPLAPYLEAVMREHNLSHEMFAKTIPPTGWCSWYQFMSEDYIGSLASVDIQENLRSLKQLKEEIPLEIIQIDDGFETQVGDWFSFNQGFSDGVAPLAAEIRDDGFTPGLWLAPFIMHPKSKLASEHPQWILRNRLGRPVNAGFLWNSFTRTLDLTHPGARDYVKEVIHSAAHDWRFSYLKLDFLYTAALPGQFHDATRTRAQVLRSALELVRKTAGEDTFLLGCGCPLGPAVGLVDSMRIGADTARRWNPYFKGIQSLLKKEASFPSAFNAVHNALTRSDIHRRWWINDPDCLLLRPETKLTKTEVETIASVIVLTGGSLVISDHVPGLPPDRLNMLKSLLPAIGKRPYVLDWFDSSTPERIQLNLDGPAGPWHLVALFNWEDTVQEKIFRASEFYLEGSEEMYAREFWTGQVHQLLHEPVEDKSIAFSQVPPHGAIVLALRPRYPYRPQYLGSNLHISQGLEVAQWRPHENNVELELERPGHTLGQIELAIPGQVEAATLNRSPIEWKTKFEGIYSFDLEFNQIAHIEINYS
jgi:alpha-galactosidase